MSKRRNFKFSSCGHLGRGAECHRCADATKLEERAAQVLGMFQSAEKSKVAKFGVDWLRKTESGWACNGFSRSFSVSGSEPSASMGEQFSKMMLEEVARLRAQPQKVAASGSLADSVT